MAAETCAVGPLERLVEFGDLLDAASAVHELVNDGVNLLHLVGAVDSIELGEAGAQRDDLLGVGGRLGLLGARADRRKGRHGAGAGGLVQRHRLEAAHEAALVGARVQHATVALAVVYGAVGDAVEAVEAQRVARGPAPISCLLLVGCRLAQPAILLCRYTTQARAVSVAPAVVVAAVAPASRRTPGPPDALSMRHTHVLEARGERGAGERRRLPRPSIAGNAASPACARTWYGGAS